MMNIKEVQLQWYINFLTKKASATRANKFSGSGIKHENMSNKELGEELHKTISRKFKRKKSILIFCR